MGSSRLMLNEISLPLLSVAEGTPDETGYKSWKFLEECGVTSSGRFNLGFYLKAIEEKASQYTILNVNPVVDIYQCMARLATIEGYDEFRSSSVLDSFFTTILDVRALRKDDIIEKIEHPRDDRSRTQEFSRMHEIYTYLADTASSDKDWRLARTAFTENKTVLGNNGIWYNLSSCLWQSPFPLAGFRDLSTTTTASITSSYTDYRSRKPVPVR
ncbi:hypothetical protein BDU57DRAFT_545737 [Ampelomyces quisqualis]|uniref:Uncharacterized protein n=1 Tax=Ampelomyces quisqualis TaxID=50730 RepID=A0A6A5QVX0_AMPQU|nr:hypothetical protein BDU57DRAFT_545737 [Ampelomyces quisqualis]